MQALSQRQVSTHAFHTAAKHEPQVAFQLFRINQTKSITKDHSMKIRHAFSITSIIFAGLTLMTLNGCATPPLAVSGASLNGAKRVAIVNIAQSEPLMLVTRNDPSGRGNVYVGAGVGGVLVGAFMAEATAINWVNNRREFNERAPANLAKDLQIQFTKLMQSEVAATGREVIIVDIKVPERHRLSNRFANNVRSVTTP